MNRRDRRRQPVERPVCSLAGRPGKIRPETPDGLLNEIARAFQIPRDRLEAGRSGAAILAERNPAGGVE